MNGKFISLHLAIYGDALSSNFFVRVLAALLTWNTIVSSTIVSSTIVSSTIVSSTIVSGDEILQLRVSPKAHNLEEY